MQGWKSFRKATLPYVAVNCADKVGVAHQLMGEGTGRFFPRSVQRVKVLRPSSTYVLYNIVMSFSQIF